MSKLKIEYGVSKTERIKLQVSIDQAVANDIELMAEWSNNEKNYIVNELLRFALAESAEFQRHRQTLPASRATHPTSTAAVPKGVVVAANLPLRSSETAR